MWIVKFLQVGVGVVGALWLAIAGAYGMYWWDRRPHGEPSIHFSFLWWHPTRSPPDSLQAQLSAAASQRSQLTVAAHNCSVALTGQNARVKALAAESSRESAAATANFNRVAQGRLGVSRTISRLDAEHAAPDDCEAANKLIIDSLGS